MKNKILICLLNILFAVVCNAQRYELYYFKSVQFDSCYLVLSHWNKLDSFEIIKHFYPVVPDIIYREKPLSIGIIIKHKDIIRCYDQKLNKYHVLKKINSSTFVSLERTDIFEKGDTLRKKVKINPK